MIKRILLSIVLLLILAYLVAATTIFNDKPVNQVCQKVEFIFKDSIHSGLITKEELSELLKHKGIYPIGKKMESIQSKILEKQLLSHLLIEKAECYKTSGGTVCIEIIQRTPVLRIMSNNGDNYYIDNKGKIIPPETNCLAHLAIVTGNAEKSFVLKNLSQFGVFLQNNKFWNAQIEQINITSEKEIELIPRVGDHIIFLGKIDNFEEKLARLKTFYEKALNQVGWNRYARISLEFGNQIICTKKEN